MSLSSPVTMVVAWVLVPALVAALGWGLGAGLARAAGLRLGALTAPVGFVAAAGLAATLLKLGLSGVLTTIVLVLLSIAWPLAALVARRRVPRPAGILPAALAALAAYVAGIAPLIGSGRSGVIGYVLSNDPSVHLAVVDLLVARGAELQPALSSLESVSGLFASGYPLGSYAWPMAATVLTGVDPFHLWTPLIALSGAMTALAAYAILASLGAGRRAAAIAAPLVAWGYLPFSYLAQGGAKEVMLATAVLVSVAAFSAALRERVDLRALLPAALSVTGALAVFGPGGLAFLGPPAVAALVIALAGAERRERLRAGIGMIGASMIALGLAAPALVASTRFVNDSVADTTDPNEIGNLVGPVPLRELANVWLAADYRFATPDLVILTWVGTLLALGLAIAGVHWSLRRRAATVPLLLLGSVVAAAYASWRYSAYFEAKTYVVLATAIGLATAAGVAGLLSRARLRRAGIALGTVVAVLVLVSAGYVHRGAWVTPKERFQELMDINERHAGRGPALVVEQEDYAKHLLRDVRPFESWGSWQPDRGLLPSVAIDPFHTPDLDDYLLAFFERFELLVERKHPGASEPPSGFRLVQDTPHYRVWERSGALPAVRHPVRRDEIDGTSPLNCADTPVAELLAQAEREDRPVRALLRSAGVTVAQPGDWAWFSRIGPGPSAGYVSAREKLAVPGLDLDPGPYDVWLRGQFGPGARVLVGDASRQVGDVFGDVGQISAWHRVGAATVRSAGEVVFVRGLELPAWRAGSSRADLVGPIAFTRADDRPRALEVPPEDARTLCGRSVDWLELP